MIYVTIYQNKEQENTAFQCIGHAEYEKSGKDIICSAVSALVINTINSVEQLVGDKFELVLNQESGLIDFSLKEGYSQESLLLIRSLILGLQGIQQSYGNDYITLIFKEV